MDRTSRTIDLSFVDRAKIIADLYPYGDKYCYWDGQCYLCHNGISWPDLLDGRDFQLCFGHMHEMFTFIVKGMREVLEHSGSPFDE